MQLSLALTRRIWNFGSNSLSMHERCPIPTGVLPLQFYMWFIHISAQFDLSLLKTHAHTHIYLTVLEFSGIIIHLLLPSLNIPSQSGCSYLPVVPGEGLTAVWEGLGMLVSPQEAFFLQGGCFSHILTHDFAM